MNQKSVSNHYLLRLKVALAAGGLAVSILGAGLLGRSADTLFVDTPPGIVTESTLTTSPEPAAGGALDLNLEAIPTVAAPTFRGAPLAFGRSSG